MTLPFEFAQQPVSIGDRTEQWRIRKSGLTFRCFRDEQHLETGDAGNAIAFFVAGRTQVELEEAARRFVGTVDEATGGWPPARTD